MKDFNKLFPAMKEQLKIIVVELDERIAFSLRLFIAKDKKGVGIGFVHDLLFNMSMYN